MAEDTPQEGPTPARGTLKIYVLTLVLEDPVIIGGRPPAAQCHLDLGDTNHDKDQQLAVLQMMGAAITQTAGQIQATMAQKMLGPRRLR